MSGQNQDSPPPRVLFAEEEYSREAARSIKDVADGARPFSKAERNALARWILINLGIPPAAFSFQVLAALQQYLVENATEFATMLVSPFLDEKVVRAELPDDAHATQFAQALLRADLSADIADISIGSTAPSSVLGPTPAADLMAARRDPSLFGKKRSLAPKAVGGGAPNCMPVPHPYDGSASLYASLSDGVFSLGKNLPTLGLASSGDFPSTENVRWTRSFLRATAGGGVRADEVQIAPLTQFFGDIPAAWITEDTALCASMVDALAPAVRMVEGFTTAPDEAINALHAAYDEDMRRRSDDNAALRGPAPISWAWIALARQPDTYDVSAGAPWSVVAAMVSAALWEPRRLIADIVRKRRAIMLRALSVAVDKYPMDDDDHDYVAHCFTPDELKRLTNSWRTFKQTAQFINAIAGHGGGSPAGSGTGRHSRQGGGGGGGGGSGGGGGGGGGPRGGRFVKKDDDSPKDKPQDTPKDKPKGGAGGGGDTPGSGSKGSKAASSDAEADKGKSDKAKAGKATGTEGSQRK